MSVTEYDAKVGDTAVTLGGRTMTFKEFKEEFPLEETWAEILEGYEDLNDDTKITVRTVRRASTSSRFGSVVDIFNPTLGKMRVEIKKDDAKYDAELAALEGTEVSDKDTVVESKSLDQLKADALAQEITSTASQASLAWLSQKENELAQLIDFLTPEQAVQLGEIIENRKQELAPDTEITSTPSISVEKGLKLTAETSIFSTRNPNKQIGQRGDIAVVSNVNEAKGTVTIKIKSDGKTSSLTISLEELDKMFKLYNEVMVKDTDVVKARPAEEQTTVKASNDTAANFVENEELQKQAETKESKMTDDEVDNNLLDDLDC